MLQGEKVKLRLVEKEEIMYLRGYLNDPEFIGKYEPFTPTTQRELERTHDKLDQEQRARAVNPMRSVVNLT